MSTDQIYQIKITLVGIRPPIWRRILVSASITLGKLHHIIQAVMDWSDYHLHQFTINGVRYGIPSPEDWEPVRDERRIKLDRIAPGEGFKFIYEYDFGDGWEHELLVEKILPPETGIEYPRCIKGRRATPPEDVGGIWGYQGFLESIQDPDDPEHDELLEWVGGEFDPEAFDLDQVNEALLHLR